MVSNLVYAEILSSGEGGIEPCLMLSVERRAAYGKETRVLRRYLFDAPEEIVRFCGSHQVKLGQLAGIFAVTGAGLAGLAELQMASVERGIPKLQVRGPPGVEAYAATVVQTIACRGSTQVAASVAVAESAEPCYEDSHIEVWAIAPPLLLDANDSSKRQRTRYASLRVGYRCRLKTGDTPEIFVLPAGGPCTNAVEKGHIAFHMGPRPAGASERDIGVSSDARRRTLWKSIERLCKWRALCGPLCPPLLASACLVLADPTGAVTAPSSGVAFEDKSSTAPLQDPVLRVYLRPECKFECGVVEAADALALEKEVVDEATSSGIWEDLQKACVDLTSSAEKDRVLIVQAAPAVVAKPPEASASTAIPEAIPAAALAAAPTAALEKHAEAEADPEFLFLGTGCAKPTSRRGQSAILLRFNGFNALLDCGGGTWAQLTRLLGKEQARSAVDNLDFVWVSHHHADHCAGLPTLLANRSRPGLRIVAPGRVVRFLRAASTFAELDDASHQVAEPLAFTAPVDGQWPMIRSVPVPHCPDSYGIILRAGATQIVYSGDCRPAQSLVAAATKGASHVSTWLVHEATFDTNQAEEAVRRKHCTTSEALQVAKRMQARGTILTHFSQRYPAIGMPRGRSAGNTDMIEEFCPPCTRDGDDDVEVADISAGAAFDGLQIRTSQFVAFGSMRATLEEYWARCFEKNERVKLHAILPPRQPLAGGIFASSMFRPAQQTTPVPGNSQLPCVSANPASCRVSTGMDAELMSKELPAPASVLPDAQHPPAAIHVGPPIVPIALPSSTPSDTTPASQDNTIAVADAPLSIPQGLASRLRLFYARLNPEKAGDSDRMAKFFGGREHDLNAKLRDRYGEDLNSQGLGLPLSSSSSSEDEEGAAAPLRAKKQIAMNSRVRDCPPPPLPPASLLLGLSGSVPALPAGKTLVREPSTRQTPEGNQNLAAPAEVARDAASSDATPGEVLQEAMASVHAAVSPADRLRKVVDEHMQEVSKPVHGTAAGVGLRSVATSDAPSLEARLCKFYEKHNPDKVGEAKQLARLFAGKEEMLNVKLRARYDGIDLSSYRCVEVVEPLGIHPSSDESEDDD